MDGAFIWKEKLKSIFAVLTQGITFGSQFGNNFVTQGWNTNPQVIGWIIQLSGGHFYRHSYKRPPRRSQTNGLTYLYLD